MSRPPKIEIEDLLKLAHDKSVEGRTTLASTISDLFIGNEHFLSERERLLMTEILNRLIHDVEMSVRQVLAEKLAVKDETPPELIKALANDEIDVARPILIKSKVLRDEELIEIIQHRTMSHQLAITLREEVSESVSAVLVEAGHEDVITSLIGNTNAHISETTMEYLVEESQRVDRYQHPLLARPDLGNHLAKKMYWWVSAALRKHIVENFEVDPAELDDTIESAVSHSIEDMEEADFEKSKSFKLARQLADGDAITPQLLVQVLRQGEISLFEALLVQMSGLRLNLVRRILFEPGGEGLAILAKSVKIEKPDFASIFLLSRKARPGDKVVDPRELSKVLNFFDKVSIEAANGVLARMRRDPDYLNSIRQLSSLEKPGKILN